MHLIYKGDVEVTIKHKKYKLHNNGTEHLFRMFVEMITRGTVAATSLPFYVMLYKSSSNEIIKKPYTKDHEENKLLTKYVLLHKYTLEEDTTHYVVFDTNITPDYRNGTHIEDTDPLCLALVSQDKLSILAAVDINHDYITYLNAGNSAIVKWTMHLENVQA